MRTAILLNVTERDRTAASEGVLGVERAERLTDLEGQARALNELTADAFVAEVVLLHLDRQGFERLSFSTSRSSETWAFVATGAKDRYLAMDEVTDVGLSHPAEATVYSPLHTQLIAWWLFHAWRSADLILDVIGNLRSWRPYPAAVMSRAVIEQCGCLVYESRKLAEAWAVCKQAEAAGGLARADHVRRTLTPLLTSSAFGTRLSQVEGRGVRATNVLTYVGKLAAAVERVEISEWYDWLSDAAHPAFGARIAGASDPLMHDSQAVMVRYHNRSPLRLQGAKGTRRFQYPVVTNAADATIVCGSVALDVLSQMLKVVDDFGLTTSAATYTTRGYWRNFTPTRGSRPCPCGRGKWADCAHRWGAAAPSLSVSGADHSP